MLIIGNFLILINLEISLLIFLTSSILIANGFSIYIFLFDFNAAKKKTACVLCLVDIITVLLEVFLITLKASVEIFLKLYFFPFYLALIPFFEQIVSKLKFLFSNSGNNIFEL